MNDHRIAWAVLIIGYAIIMAAVIITPLKILMGW